MFETIIVGSGPAGASAALKLKGRDALVVDIGNVPAKKPFPDENFYSILERNEDHFKEIIGEKYESLHNIDNTYLMPKLKAPLMRFVVDRNRDFCPIEENDFFAMTSFAKGGLANVWGAQVYKFTDKELRSFPYKATDLEKYYNELSNYMGINGENDDLTRFYGRDETLMPPMEIGSLCMGVLNTYKKHKELFNRKGFFIGRPRLGLNTRTYGKRPAYNYDALEFFNPRNESIFSPSYIIDDLVEKKEIKYLPGKLALKFTEEEGGVALIIRDIKSGNIETLHSKRLILAAGTLNTARIVLESYNDFDTRLPFLDNLISYVPLVSIKKIGSSLDRKSFATQLSMLYEGPDFSDPIMCTLYSIGGVLRSDLLMKFPFSIATNLIYAKYILPAMLLVQLWYPASIKKENYLKLEKNDKLRINYTDVKKGAIERLIINTFLRFGYFGNMRLCEYPLAGNSFHYAGTFPMINDGNLKYFTHNDGRLNVARNVYLADASSFPYLPSKNLTFTIMANSMRIAEKFL